MKHFFISTLLFVFVCSVSAEAQTSGPRKPPTASKKTTQPETESSNRQETRQATTTTKFAPRTVNGIEVTLKGVAGNAADQTVNLELVLNNPKGNTRVVLRSAYAVDLEGDNYLDKIGYSNSFEETLYTDVPRKAQVGIGKIPDKIKTLKLFKFILYNQLTNQEIEVEFRDLPIEW